MQALKTKQKENTNLKVIVFTAVFAALVLVSTSFIKIPTLFGYVHVGDSMVYLAACMLPGPYGMLAGAIGGGLADLMAGYPHWVLPTAIIKACNALPFILVKFYLNKRDKGDRIINIPNLAMLIPTSLVTIYGYFLAHLIMYDWAAAVAGLSTEWIQPTAGAIIFVSLGVGLDAIKAKKLLDF